MVKLSNLWFNYIEDYITLVSEFGETKQLIIWLLCRICNYMYENMVKLSHLQFNYFEDYLH